ncbi:hypothetical protein AB0I60_02795 [Actinosynnema sp. NPDC050436]
MGRHSRKPRRRSRFVLVLQVGFVVLQLCLALIEGLEVIARLLGNL